MGIYIILYYILRKYLTFTKKVRFIFGNIELKGWAQKKCANEVLCGTLMTSISWFAPCTLQHLICAAIPHLSSELQTRHQLRAEDRHRHPSPPQPSPGDNRVRRGREKNPFSFYLFNFNATNPLPDEVYVCICLCVRVPCNHCNNQTCSIRQIHPRPCNVNVLRLRLIFKCL